ncbi:MAG: hypothetical protein K2H02_01875, partial [Anaeroplasmataceae bacterium]|nr:hypothetical protein [Anaeroplasmataceae bacterium]
ILGAALLAGGIAFFLNLETSEDLAYAISFSLLGVILLCVGLVTLLLPSKVAEIVDEKLEFTGFKIEPMKSIYFDQSKKKLSIPMQDIVYVDVQSASKSGAVGAAILGGAIGAALAANSNPDKLIIQTKESKLTVLFPQQTAMKVRKKINLPSSKTKEEMTKKPASSEQAPKSLADVPSMKHLDDEE